MEFNLELIDSIIEAISMGMFVTENQINYLESFIKTCINNNISGYINSPEMQQLFDKYENYATINGYINENIKAIMTKYNDFIRNTVDKGAMYSKESIKKLSYKNGNANILDENLTKLDRLGFISTAIILEASLVVAFILSLIALVKK